MHPERETWCYWWSKPCIIFRLHVLCMEKKIIQWLVAFFFNTHFGNLQFVHFWQFAACPPRFLTLKQYISERIGWSVLVSWKLVRQGCKWPCLKLLPIENFSPRSYQRKYIKSAERFLGKSSNLTSISTIRIRWLPILVGRVRNQPFLMPY